MNIRRATRADVAALAVVEQNQPCAAGWGKKGFETEMEQSCSVIWCAEVQKELVGFVAARVAADVAEILNVAVFAGYTKQGIGRTLLSRTLQDLKQCGVRQVSLEVAQSNAAACALYVRAGFIKQNMRKDFYGVGQNAWIMGKNL